MLVEGDTVCDGVKMEVWRAAVGSEPMALADPKIRAVITDNEVDLPVPKISRRDVAAIAATVLDLLGLPPLANAAGP